MLIRSRFLTPTLGLFSCIALLNVTKRLSICSLLFVLACLFANRLSEQHGPKKTFHILAACVGINAFLVVTHISPALTTYSGWPEIFMGICFLSAAFSIQVGVLLYEKLKFRWDVYISRMISLSFASLLDSSVVICSLYSLNKFPLEKAVVAYFWDIAFKLVYSSLSVAIIFYITQQKMHRTRLD